MYVAGRTRSTYSPFLTQGVHIIYYRACTGGLLPVLKTAGYTRCDRSDGAVSHIKA